MITVLGATGHTGGRVTTQLRAAGEKVRAVGRSAERLATVGAEPWVGDASDPAFLTEAFRGTDAAYVLMPLATRILGDGIGMADLEYVRLPDAEMVGLLTGAGLPAHLAELHVAMNRAFNDGTVVSRSGRTPATTTSTSLEEFAAAQR